jgi:hypothetical protein
MKLVLSLMRFQHPRIGENEMKSQVYFATETGIISKEAVKQLKGLITNLNGTVRSLDACGGAKQSRRVADIQLTDELRMRRNNLIATIAILKDHLHSVENLRSHGYHPPIFDPTDCAAASERAFDH